MEALTVGSLFAGIGGFDLGLERAGLRTVWFCEQDPFCQRVLAKHWPGVPCHPDVRTLVANAERVGQRRSADVGGGADALAGSAGADGLVPVPVPYVDVLCGGFPCQDLSYAGRGAGIEGSRSGLWGEFARLVGELRPRYVLVENVPALTARGLDRVLADLAACGFDAEWDHLPAAAFGAPHRRDRIWLVAYPAGGAEGRGAGERAPEWGSEPGVDGPAQPLAYPSRDGAGQSTEAGAVGERVGAGGQPGRAGDVADTEVEPVGAGLCESGSRGVGRGRSGDGGGTSGNGEPLAGVGDLADGLPTGLTGHWDREPDISRVAVGVDERVNKLRALGNSLVPQIAEWIGRRIVDYEQRVSESPQEVA